MSCDGISVVTMGCSIDLLDVFFSLNSRIPEVTLGNLCIGVDARFRPTFSDRNFGALFEVLLCWLDESEIV